MSTTREAIDAIAASAIAWDRRIWGPDSGPAALVEAPCYVTHQFDSHTLLEAHRVASEQVGRWVNRNPRLTELWALTATEIGDDLAARLAGPTEPF